MRLVNLNGRVVDFDSDEIRYGVPHEMWVRLLCELEPAADATPAVGSFQGRRNVATSNYYAQYGLRRYEI